jgi:hypothetical protein
MAEFCKDCSLELLGIDIGKGGGDTNSEEFVQILCEGCGGYVLVDSNMQRVPGAEIITLEMIRKYRQKGVYHE